jgi:chromosome segregation ATPase
MTSLFSHFDLNTIIIAVVGAMIAFGQWRSGQSKISTETIDAYKSQVEIYEKRLTANTDTINAMTGKIGELTGSIAAKDKQIEDMHATILNRNPELEIVLKQLTHFMESVDKRLQAVDAQLLAQAEHLAEMRTHQLKPVHVTNETTITK